MRNAMIITIILTLLTVSSVFADVSYEYPTEDTFVTENDPDDNFGSLDGIFFGYSSGNFVGLIEFDLSSYSGATINSSTLALYRCNGIGPVPESVIYRLSGSWDENSVTYNTLPSWNTALSVNFVPPSSDGWIYIGLTDIVRSWVDGSFDNNGLRFGPTDPIYGISVFRSKEYSNPDLHPVLQITYEPLGVESASLGEIKAAFK